VKTSLFVINSVFLLLINNYVKVILQAPYYKFCTDNTMKYVMHIMVLLSTF